MLSSGQDQTIKRATRRDIIKTRVTRMIEQELQDDPYTQEAFSVLLRQAIEKADACTLPMVMSKSRSSV